MRPRPLRDLCTPASLAVQASGSVLPMHALIIEDELLTAQLIEDRLRDLGFTPFAFAVGEDEAVSAAHGRCPDLITSDVAMVQERCPYALVVQKPFGTADLHAAIQELRKAA